MTVSLTCKACGAELSADSDNTLMVLGERHAQEHGHDRYLPREHILDRIRRHNPQPGIDADGRSVKRRSEGE